MSSTDYTWLSQPTIDQFRQRIANLEAIHKAIRAGMPVFYVDWAHVQLLLDEQKTYVNNMEREIKQLSP